MTATERQLAEEPYKSNVDTFSPLVQPGKTGLWVPLGSQFRIQVWNSSSIATFLGLRYVVKGSKPNEEYFNQVFGRDFNAGRLLNDVYSVQLPEGELICAEIGFGNANVKPGECFVAVHLIQSANVKHITQVAAGYVYAGHNLDWPLQQGGPPVPDTFGHAFTGQPANPAAGANFLVTVPAGAYWDIKQVSALLTCSAAAADRQPSFIIKDPSGNTVDKIECETTMIASDALRVNFNAGLGRSFAAPDIYCGVPDSILLPPGWQFGVSGTLQGADQWSSINYRGIEWLQP